ncbi:hypothetical protein LX36DRAFT_539200, partial [Colletotrichum falcatum]
MTEPVQDYVAEARFSVVPSHRFLEAFLETAQDRAFPEHVLEVRPEPAGTEALFVDCVPRQWRREILQGDDS